MRRTPILTAAVLASLAGNAFSAETTTAVVPQVPGVLQKGDADSLHATPTIPILSGRDEHPAPPPQLTGSASFSASERDYELGNRALEARQYNEAQLRLNRALIELNKTRDKNNLKVLAHLELAEAYLGLDNFDKAQLRLNESRPMCLSTFGAESAEMARLDADVAELNLNTGNSKLAVSNANESLRIRAKIGTDARAIALSQMLVGRALFKQSYYEDAKEYLKKSLSVLELQPGKDRLDYANALAALAIVEKKLGNEKESDDIMNRALSLKTDAVYLDKTADQKGLVKFPWIEGMHGSRQIVDPEYPLKYMVVDGVRVACTLVRSYKHLGVLISLANCSKKPVQIAVGAAKLEKITPGRKLLEFCDPGLIDEVLEEDVILDRTWRRRTLCHIEKSRNIPGYLRNGILDPDDFFGNNTFGLYGAWDNNLREAPPIVTREQFFYDDRPKNADQEVLGFMRGNGSMRPTYIEVGGARTGVVFFLRERYEDAMVRILIGNAELQFPFHVTPGQ